mmetsp:Transcript_28505/g.72533  ORF Transcript_28505/g.72533 Transcript_28505/m.72533 type:complete len:299 (-) Transcript_28505:627-1523(-)
MNAYMEARCQPQYGTAPWLVARTRCPPPHHRPSRPLSPARPSPERGGHLVHRAQHGRAQRRRALRRPPHPRHRVAGRVLEGHLQRQRQRAKPLADLLATQGEVGFAGCICRVAMRDLEIGRVAHERGAKRVLQRLQPRVPGGDAVQARHEAVGQLLVAVHVHQQVHARGVHGSQRARHLGGGGGVRVRPRPVEVHARCVGAQVAARGAVRAHVGHGVHHALRPHRPRHRIVRVSQPLQQPLHEKLRHGLTRVLARDDPHLALPRALLAHLQQVHGPPLARVPHHAQPHARPGLHACHQ